MIQLLQIIVITDGQSVKMIHSASFTPANPHSDHLVAEDDLTSYLLEEGGGGGRVVEMSIFTDEIISREADNIRDIISGAISIFISQRQQRQPTNIIKQHSRAFSWCSLSQTDYIKLCIA